MQYFLITLAKYDFFDCFTRIASYLSTFRFQYGRHKPQSPTSNTKPSPTDSPTKAQGCRHSRSHSSASADKAATLPQAMNASAIGNPFPKYIRSVPHQRPMPKPSTAAAKPQEEFG